MAHQSRRGTAGTAQHPSAAKPGRRVVAVRMGRKAWVGLESAGGPFPHIAPGQVGLGHGRTFPLHFGRQAAACPLAPSLRVVPSQMNGGTVQIQRSPLAKALLLPLACNQLTHMRRKRPTGGLHKGQVATPRYRCLVDDKRIHRHVVPPLFVVKRKARRAAPPHGPCLSRHPDLLFIAGLHGPCPGQVSRHGQAQVLRHVDSGLVVHGLMRQCQPPEVQAGIILSSMGQQGQRFCLRLRQVGQRLVQAGQWQMPACGVRHFAGVVPGIGLWQARRSPPHQRIGRNTLCALRVAGDPPVLKPGHVAPFPQGWVQRLGIANA